MGLSELRHDTHHRQRKIFLRVMAPSIRFFTIVTVVEDLEGNAVQMSLNVQPHESVVPAKETVWPGRICIVKEPFFWGYSDNPQTVVIDHLSDII